MAATKIGLVSALLVAKTRQYERGMKRARKTTGLFAKGLKAAQGAVKSFGLGLLGVFGAGAVVGKLRDAAAAMDDLAKKAALLGLTTEKLAGLQLAANLAGIKVETFNMGLQRMVRRVAEAAQGTGEAISALRELGLEARVLASLSPDEQFKRIADAMQNVGTQGDRVRLAMKLFDSEGVRLTLVMRGGARALQEAEMQARLFGTAINSIDAAKIERVNDAFTRAGAATSGLANTLTLQTVGLWDTLADTWTRIALGARVIASTDFSGIGGGGSAGLAALQAGGRVEETKRTLLNLTLIEGLERRLEATLSARRAAAGVAASKVDQINAENRRKALGSEKLLKKWRAEAKALTVTLQTPMEALNAQLERAALLFNKGVLGAEAFESITGRIASRMAELGGVTKDASQQLQRIVSRGVQGTKFAGANEVGSVAARRATFSAQNVRSERFQRQTTKNTKDTADGVERVADALEVFQPMVITTVGF